MNPQLEQHLREFELTEGVCDTLSDNHDLAEEHSDFDEVVSCKPEKFLPIVESFSREDLLLLGGIFLSVVVLVVAEWKQLFVLNVEISIGGHFLLFPGTTIAVLGLFFMSGRIGIGSQKNAIQNSPNIMGKATMQKYQQQQCECRLHLSKILGTLGAPFLLQDSAPKVSENKLQFTKLIRSGLKPTEISRYYSDVLSRLVDLAESHVKLLQTMDIGIEVVKMGTALQLGATNSTVERVERALYGRQARQIGMGEYDTNSPSSGSVPPSFHTVRCLVSQAMLYQAKSLDSILFHVATMDGSTSSLQTEGHLDGEEKFSLGVARHVITLSWMRSSRQHLVALLSDVLNETTTYSFSLLREYDSCKELLRSSISMTEETNQHLASVLALHGQDTVGSPKVATHDSSAVSSFAQLRKTLHSLYVSLWAMEDVVQRASNNHKDECDENLTDWWIRINELNNVVNTSLLKIDKEYFSDQTITSTATDETEAAGEAIVSPKVASNDNTVAELVDTPLQIEQRKSNMTKATKTAVYSGEGALVPAKSKGQRRTRLSTCEDDTAAPSFQSDPIAHHKLLSELSKRLQTLSLPEEEHETGNFPKDDVNTSQNRTEKTTAVPCFGSLLVSELSSTITTLGYGARVEESSDPEEENDWE